MEGYCVKCKSKKEINDAKTVKLKTGMRACKGTCTTCGTKMTRIIGK